MGKVTCLTILKESRNISLNRQESLLSHPLHPSSSLLPLVSFSAVRLVCFWYCLCLSPGLLFLSSIGVRPLVPAFSHTSRIDLRLQCQVKVKDQTLEVRGNVAKALSTYLVGEMSVKMQKAVDHKCLVKLRLHYSDLLLMCQCKNSAAIFKMAKIRPSR